MTFCEMYKMERGGCYECPNRYVCKKDINIVRKHFLQVVCGITGALESEVKILFFERDSDGLFRGTVEINGNEEYIHEYHC